MMRYFGMSIFCTRGVLGLFWGLVLGLAGCATPIAPTGGKPQNLPPKLLSSQPANQAVNVQTKSIKLLFSNYLDLSNFTKALSITPSFRQPLRVRWQGREAEIIFPEPLRAGTTYVLQLGTDLRDWNGVQLKEPIVLAFATGDKLNKAELSGLVQEPKQGNLIPLTDVFAWEGTGGPDFSRDPDYHTQTDANGRFNFRYLPEVPFFIMATQDRNRNRRIDPTEPFALPPFRVLRAEVPDTTTFQPPQPIVRYNPLPPFNVLPDTTKARPVSPQKPPKWPIWLMAKPDTTAPIVRSVRAITARRLAVTFSEPVYFTDAKRASWTLEDSLNQTPIPIRKVYQLSDNPRLVYLETDSMRVQRHLLRISHLADSTGNRLRMAPFGLTGVARADTLKMRFLGFGPEPPIKLIRNVAVLWVNAWPEIRFNLPPDTAFLTKHVSVTDTLAKAIPFSWQTKDGTTLQIMPTSFEAGATIRISVDGALQRKKEPIIRTFERLRNSERGSIVGTVKGGGTSPILVELIPVSPTRLDQALYRTTADPNGRFSFKDLPEGTYRLRAVRDVNGNGRWDAGSLSPFAPAERIVWGKEPLTLRVRWENETPPLIFEEE